MKHTILWSSTLLACQVLAAGPDLSFKLRTLVGLATVDGVRNGLGAGVDLGLEMGGGTLEGELGYQYLAGKQYRETAPMPYGFRRDPGDPEVNSLDSRKNSLQGITVRLGYRRRFTEGLSWQAGLALASLKNHHESITSWKNAAQASAGNWELALDRTRTTVSPFAGLRLELDAIGALEFNVLLLSYRTATVEPGIQGGTTVVPVLGERRLSRPKLEFAYVFKF